MLRQRPDGPSLLILTFSNGCILLTSWSIYTKLGDFVKLGLHFMTMWICGSIVANPIIYRLAPSPSRFENRQWVSISMHACDPVPIVMGLRLAALRATGGAPR